MFESTGSPGRGRTAPPPPSPLPLQPPARATLIRRSHERCEALGLRRIERPDFEPMLRGDLTVARERSQRLLGRALPVMEMLGEQIVDSDSMVLLTDAQGTVLHSMGDQEFMSRADKVALAPGVNWAEQSKGTNAIGTALFEEQPTLVHADEHFIYANQFLTCSAAPIFGLRGDILGVVDVSGDQRSYHRHTMALVRMSARMIENQSLRAEHDHCLRLHFHSRAEFIGTLLEGIVVIDEEGRILGANRSGLQQLGLSDMALRAHTVDSLFGTTFGALHDQACLPVQTPLPLALPNGQMISVRPRVGGLPQGAFRNLPHANDPGPSGSFASPTSTTPGVPVRPPRAPRLDDLRTGDARVDLVVQKVRRVLNRDIPLLLLGETGTGKELLARAVHQESNRAKQPFVAVNCASIPESLIEAELFGYEDGAFTGARRNGSVGRIVQANGGTLFLDEIGDMPLPLQSRLLRVLQERCVTPLGSHKNIVVDFAVIGATHCDLHKMIEKQQFREDLYYRLSGLVLRLPALRERGDLVALVHRILRAEFPQERLGISPSVMDLFLRYPWPGNIRQLSNVLRSAVAMLCGSTCINRSHLPDDFLDDADPGAPPPLRAVIAHGPETTASTSPVAAEQAATAASAVAACAARQTLEAAEIEIIRQALSAAQGNISEAAKQLGISRNTIYRKLRTSPGAPTKAGDALSAPGPD